MMLKVVFLLMLIGCMVCSRPRISRLQANRVARIAGGTKISAGDAPFVVRLEMRAPGYGEPYNCAGSILNTNWILTAAHCAGDYLQFNGSDAFTPSHGYFVTVIAGEVSKDVTEPDEQRVGVQQVFVNKGYHHDNIYTDIAMLLLATPLTLSANVAAITLGTQLPAAGAAITVVGWGTVPETGELSNDLLKVEYVVTPSDNCSKAYPEGFWGEDWKMPADQFCTGYWDMKKHHAPGDSGGPLFVKSGGTFTQYGIVSWGDDTGENWIVPAGSYDVNTDVTQFVTWIAEIQKKETYTKLMATLTATDTAQFVAWSATASSNYNYQSWAITATAYIELKVTDFAFPGTYDMFTIFDGPSPNSTIIAQLHYTKDWSSKQTYTSSSTTMFVVVRTDKYQGEGNSVKFSYRSVTKSKSYNTDCNTGWTACCDLKQCYERSAYNDSFSDCFDESDEPNKVNKTCGGAGRSEGGGIHLVLALLGYLLCTQWV